jgi:hypothetical protein
VASSHAGEDGLVFLAEVRTLLNFDHFDLLEDLEAVAAGHEKNDVARAENPALEIRLRMIVEIHSQAASRYQQHLLRLVYLPKRRIMIVCRDLFPRWMTHVRKLLRKFVGREEMNARLSELTAHDDRKDNSMKKDSFDWIIHLLFGTDPL